MSGLFHRLAQRTFGTGFGISPIRSPVSTFTELAGETANREAPVGQFASAKSMNDEPAAPAPVPPESGIHGGHEERSGPRRKPSQQWDAPDPDLDDPGVGHDHAETIPGPPALEVRAEAVGPRVNLVHREAFGTPAASINESRDQIATTAAGDSTRSTGGQHENGPAMADHSTRPVVHVPSVTHVRSSSASPTVVAPGESPAPAVRPETGQPEAAGQVPATQQVPTIQVTIGRVEVRADAARNNARPARKSNRSAPRLTLDDYMQQRSSGQR